MLSVQLQTKFLEFTLLVYENNEETGPPAHTCYSVRSWWETSYLIVGALWSQSCSPTFQRVLSYIPPTGSFAWFVNFVLFWAVPKESPTVNHEVNQENFVIKNFYHNCIDENLNRRIVLCQKLFAKRWKLISYIENF